MKPHTICAVLVMGIPRMTQAQSDSSPTQTNNVLHHVRPTTQLYDKRIVCFGISENGSGRLFLVSLSISPEEKSSIEFSDISLQVLDQTGKVIPTVDPDGQKILSSVGNQLGGYAEAVYLLRGTPDQIPSAVNFGWRGKQQYIVLTKDNYQKM